MGSGTSSGVELIRSIVEMHRKAADARRAGRRLALVPTMGALHEGHASLMRQAREQGAAVVVSLYVNPTQFGPTEDFRRYPRTLEADQRLCSREGVDVVFAPVDDEMYPGGLWSEEGHNRPVAAVPAAIRGLQYSTFVDENVLARRLEGERRPGHFRGVCTVVAKLLHIVQPDLAVFGRKDYQQLKVIERMVRDLQFPVTIVAAPTAREPDGLALSSRNRFLSPNERAQATVLWKALSVAQDMFNNNETNAHRLAAAMLRTVELAPAARLDYAEIASPETLEQVHEVKRGDVALVAAFLGKTRLIDNLTL